MNSENSVQKFVCSLTNEKNPGHKLKVKSEWRDKEGTLTILDSSSAWTGRIGEKEISCWSKPLGKTEDEYFQETMQMLTSSEESLSFSYALDNGSFTWKKKVEGDIKIKFGSIALESIPIHHIANEFIDILLISNKKLNKRIAFLKNAIVSHQTAQNNLRYRLEKYPSIIAEEEKILYENFLRVLNAEKDIICSLHKKLDDRFNVKDVLLSHSRVLKNFDENSKDQEVSTGNPYDSATDVDTDVEVENDTEIESNATNSQKTDSQNSTENFCLDDSEDSPVLVLTRSQPCSQPSLKKITSEAMAVDFSEPGPSSVHHSPVTETKSWVSLEPEESEEASITHQLLYNTQDLFDDL